MSEQLKQLDAWVKIGERFEYFNLWNVTIQSLAKNNIIPKKDYGDYNIKRPDGILVDRTNKKNPSVIAVIEYKSWEKFQKEKDIEEAIRQCNDYAQVLWAIFGVATDTNISTWINPNEENKENEYQDDFWNTRSYSFIKDEEKQRLSNNFYFQKQKIDQTNEEKLADEVKETLKIIKRILDSDIWKNNSELKDTIYVDPTNLAKSVWQDIYVATGKEPEKCLYNVVEIFIFKFLSDLWVLQSIYSFKFLIEMIKAWDKDEDILKHYANTIRPKIKKELFPADIEDGTTIMNGTIFVNEKSEPVLEFASLFKKSIVRYDNFWDLTNVEKAFKTKLYETFLKRDSWVKWMGQFFTPRKVVRNIVEMAKVENLKSGSRVCDPFCWVWGFPLEVMARRNNKDFVIKNWKIIEDIEYFGFDKWSSEKDSERTIILAKANMLIYLSELIKEYPKLTVEFSKIFNKTFKLKKWTLGTLADVWDDEEDKFDLIITNPPYVTSWSSILKEEIAKDQDKIDFYKTNWMWVEGLSIEWIINKLKKWWKAFIVLPEWIFTRNSDRKIREFILKECLINWIISLPQKTFFMTPQKTAILAITKKDRKEQQIKPVFTYLVSDIWETLDVFRFDTWKSELEKAKKLFKMFDWNEEDFESPDPRCKIWGIDEFINNVDNNWIIDRWWTKDEKIALWIEDQEDVLGIEDFLWKVRELKGKTFAIEESILQIIEGSNQLCQKFWDIKIADIFDVEKWKSLYTNTYIHENTWDFPVFSSQTTNNWEIWKIDSYDYNCPCITWTTDWVHAWTVFLRKNVTFSMTTHCGALIPKSNYKNEIYIDYVYRYLSIILKQYAIWNDNKRVTTWIIKDIFIKIPMRDNGEFDLEKQKEIASRYEKIEKIQQTLIEELEYLEKVKVEI